MMPTAVYRAIAWETSVAQKGRSSGCLLDPKASTRSPNPSGWDHHTMMVIAVHLCPMSSRVAQYLFINVVGEIFFATVKGSTHQ